MKVKVEELARELVALIERYTLDDFKKAKELITSGKLFEKSINVTEDVFTSLKGPPRKHVSTSKREVRSKAQGPATPPDSNRASGQLSLDRILENIESDSKNDLISFAIRFQSGEILRDSASLRAFVQHAGLAMPKLNSSRSSIARALVLKLKELPSDVRSDLLSDFTRYEVTDSALERWSDLIVKRGSE